MRHIRIASAFMIISLAILPTACERAPEPTKPAIPATGERFILQLSDTSRWQDVSAEIATVDQTHVMARIPGILTKLSVREGDVVAKGQVIGTIFDSQLSFQAGAYTAQAAAVQAQAVQAQAELKRVRTLYQSGIYAPARLEQAQAAADAAQAQVRVAQAQKAAIDAVAGQGIVVAPTAGRVLRADVPAGSPVAPGTIIAVITAGPTILRLDMPESLTDHVHAGARVMAQTAGGQSLVGRISRLYPAVTAGQVTADVDVPGLGDAPIGRRLATRVETGTRKALLVPAAYVTTRYGIDYVTVLASDGAASEIPVQTTPSFEAGKVEILSGVSAGDTLLKAGNHKAAHP